jgi:hypothetical protein
VSRILSRPRLWTHRIAKTSSLGWRFVSSLEGLEGKVGHISMVLLQSQEKAFLMHELAISTMAKSGSGAAGGGGGGDGGGGGVGGGKGGKGSYKNSGNKNKKGGKKGLLCPPPPPSFQVFLLNFLRLLWLLDIIGCVLTSVCEPFEAF